MVIATTTSTPPLVLIQQKATIILEGTEEHQQQVPSTRKQQLEGMSAKQILFLDDYEQIDEKDNKISSTINGEGQSTAIEHSMETSNTRIENRMKELEETRQKLQQQLYQEDGEEDFSSDEDEDLFFFKPGYLSANLVSISKFDFRSKPIWE